MYGKGLRPLSIATVVMFAITLSLVFFYAPIEADQGFLQKIFYLHVPLAIISLCGFVIGGIFAVLHLRRDDPRDLADLLQRDRVVSLQILADPRKRPLAQQLAHAPVDRLGDQQARRVGADIDAGTDHPTQAIASSDGENTLAATPW